MYFKEFHEEVRYRANTVDFNPMLEWCTTPRYDSEIHESSINPKLTLITCSRLYKRQINSFIKAS